MMKRSISLLIPVLVFSLGSAWAAPKGSKKPRPRTDSVNAVGLEILDVLAEEDSEGKPIANQLDRFFKEANTVRSATKRWNPDLADAVNTTYRIVGQHCTPLDGCLGGATLTIQATGGLTAEGFKVSYTTTFALIKDSAPSGDKIEEADKATLQVLEVFGQPEGLSEKVKVLASFKKFLKSANTIRSASVTSDTRPTRASQIVYRISGQHCMEDDNGCLGGAVLTITGMPGLTDGTVYTSQVGLLRSISPE